MIAAVLDSMDMTDVQWAVLEPAFRSCRRPDGRGRPLDQSTRCTCAVRR
jgi:hypothetical protein